MRNKALRANKENIALADKNKSELNRKNTEIKNKFIEKANKIKKKVEVHKAVREDGDLYAIIKPKEISKAHISDELKTDITPSK